MTSKGSGSAFIVVICLAIGVGCIAVDRLIVPLRAAQAVALSDVDRLRAENAVLRANLNEAQRQIVDLTGKLLAADRSLLAEKIRDTYHADLDWQTLLLKPMDLPAKENKR